MIKSIINVFFIATLLSCTSCAENGTDGIDGVDGTNGADGINGVDGTNGMDGAGTSFFSTASTFSLGDGVPEISAYDANTQKVFSTNSEAAQVDVIDISDVNTPKQSETIDITLYGGNVNSVACSNGFLAIAVEATTVTDNGKVVIFNTENLTTPVAEVTAGALPDMVTFTPDGAYIIVANEGEPNDAYTVDPSGSITVIDMTDYTATQVTFDAFNADEATLAVQGFRVFGPGANLSTDVEPEYITVSSDSKTAYIALQENNGIAKLDIETKTITDIYPLGTKDYTETIFDLSDEDNTIGNLKSWPVLSFYQPDAIDYFEIGGVGYIISANEGDARDYDGFSEEERCADLELDSTTYPDAATLQLDENLGRLKVTTVNGDIDGDGDIDQIYGYGARSFSIWSTTGDLIFDSGNEFTLKTLNEFGSYPENRSDDKGTEPESVTTYTDGVDTYAIIGLERSGDVLVYNINDVYNPRFIQRLRNTSPEGLLIVKAEDSPNGKTLLIVSNEYPSDATLNIYTL